MPLKNISFGFFKINVIVIKLLFLDSGSLDKNYANRYVYYATDISQKLYRISTIILNLQFRKFRENKSDNCLNLAFLSLHFF